MYLRLSGTVGSYEEHKQRDDQAQSVFGTRAVTYEGEYEYEYEVYIRSCTRIFYQQHYYYLLLSIISVLLL